MINYSGVVKTNQGEYMSGSVVKSQSFFGGAVITFLLDCGSLMKFDYPSGRCLSHSPERYKFFPLK